MILNTIEGVYNLKLKKHENDNILFYKKMWKDIFMSTLLENNNNIILWESVKWLLLWVLHFMT